MLSKFENFGGKNLPIPIIYGNPQGRSASFSTAQANKTNTQIKDFTLTRNHDYSLASIDNETLEASQGSSNAFMEAATTEIDGAINSAARSLAIALYGSGTGRIGKIAASGISTLTITLDTVEDITNFEVGQKLNFSTADGGGSVRATEPTVTNVDRNLGKIIVTDVTSLAAADYIFIDGDYDAKLKGLAAWLPTTVTATAFFGMDRSVDSSRLGGIQFDGSNQPIEEALVGAASRVAREGGKPTHVFLCYSKYAELEKALGKHLTH